MGKLNISKHLLRKPEKVTKTPETGNKKNVFKKTISNLVSKYRPSLKTANTLTHEQIVKNNRFVMEKIRSIKTKYPKLDSELKSNKFVEALKAKGITAENLKKYTTLHPESIFSVVNDFRVLQKMGFDVENLSKLNRLHFTMRVNMRALEHELVRKRLAKDNVRARQELNKFFSLRSMADKFTVTELFEAFPFDRIVKEVGIENIKESARISRLNLENDEQLRKYANQQYTRFEL